MPPPPAARAKLLDAYIAILIDQGERAATLEAVAAAAGVSKGGLLYHFGSKDALAQGLIGYLAEVVALDAAHMRDAPEGAVAYYLRTSTYTDSPLDRAIVAVSRLSQNANAHAQEAIRAMQQQWFEVVRDEVGDPVAARAVILLGDGLYYNAALTGNEHSEASGDQGDYVEQLLVLVRKMLDEPESERI